MGDDDGVEGFGTRNFSNMGDNDNTGGCRTQHCLKTGGNNDTESIGTKTQCCFLAATDSVLIRAINSLSKLKQDKQHSLEKLNGW